MRVRAVREGCWLVVGALVYAAATQAGLLLKAPEASVAYFWPAAGVGAALMIIGLQQSRERTVTTLTGIILANLALNAAHGESALMVMGFTLANGVESLIMALLFVRLRRTYPKPALAIPAMMMSATAAVLVSACFALALLTPVTTDPMWRLAVNWAIPDLAGIVVITSVLLVPRPVPDRRRLEAAAQMCALAALCLVVDVALHGLPIAWTALPLLVWSAMRLGTTWTSVCCCLVAFASGTTAAQGRGPFGSGSELAHMLAGQGLDAVTVFTAMSLAIVATDRAELAQALSWHDPLTGLANRRFLDEHARRQLVQVHSRAITSVFCDIVGFKLINDRHGHRIGDQVLQSVAQRFQTIVRPTDLVARLGGDEFVVLCTNLQDPEMAHEIRRRILGLAQEPMTFGDRTFDVALSVGLALADHARPLDELLHEADQNMYEHKARQHQALTSGGL